jgi:hypothetical protein
VIAMEGAWKLVLNPCVRYSRFGFGGEKMLKG